MKKCEKTGFTLVEISIVLVIIGLLAGGILAGRDLILAAQVRAQISQIEQLNTAVFTFRSKYNCLPGDCPNATDFGLGTVGGDGDNGNGNGQLDVSLDAGPPVVFDSESTDFWYHLGKSGLMNLYPYPLNTNLPVPGINSPPLKLPGTPMGAQGGLWVTPKFTVGYDAGANYVSIAPAYLFTTSVNFFIGSSNGVYLPTLAGLLDRKIDDGLPRQGDMIAAMFWTGFGCGNNECLVYIMTAHLPDSCIDQNFNPPQYSIRAQAQTPTPNSLCMPILKAEF